MTSLVSNRSRASAHRTWAGNLVSIAAHAKVYLHLYAFPCEKCNGPVVVGSLGTREDDYIQRDGSQRDRSRLPRMWRPTGNND